MSGLIAAVRIRGIHNMKPRLRKTLELLRLEKPNHCVVMKETPQAMGMLLQVKDYISYGAVSEASVKLLLEKRGTKGSRKLSQVLKKDEMEKAAKEIAGGAKVKDIADPVFRLHPPKGGLKDVKRAYPLGELGRRDEMDSLIRRMV